MPAQPALLDAQLRQALGLHQARRLAEAEALYRQVLAFRPDLAEGMSIVRSPNSARASMVKRKPP